MSTLVLMKILESSPSRYDRGMRLLTRGRIDQYYLDMVDTIHEGSRVLDIGCGTGILSILAAQKGAQVTAIDINPEMLEIARTRASDSNHLDQITFEEKGVAELDGEQANHYDIILASMVFSELEIYERVYTITQIARILKNNGRLIILDESRPSNIITRLIHRIIRFPLVIMTYILTQTTTKSLDRLDSLLQEGGLLILEKKTNWLGSITRWTIARGDLID